MFKGQPHPLEVARPPDKALEAQIASLPSRRDFLSRAGGVALAAIGLGAVGVAARFFLPSGGGGAAAQVPIGVPGDFKVGSLNWLREQELFVVRDEQGFGAFSSRCTHLGCTVKRTAEGFSCPCHGARFDPKGGVVRGPARRNLPWHPLWLADGMIWVDLSREVAPITALLTKGAGA